MSCCLITHGTLHDFMDFAQDMRFLFSCCLTSSRETSRHGHQKILMHEVLENDLEQELRRQAKRSAGKSGQFIASVVVGVGGDRHPLGKQDI